MIRKIVTGVVVLSLLLSPLSMGCVKANDVELVPYHSELIQGTENEVIIHPMMYGTYLWYGTATITNPSIGHVGASGTTFAHKVVPKLSVQVHLQQYRNGKWSTVASWTTDATNKMSVGSAKLFKVNRGYYYRVYSVHTANGETTFGATSGIYIA